MLQQRLLLILSISLLVLFSACSDTINGTVDEPVSEIEVQTVENLYAPSDRSNPDAFSYVYFNLRTGETVDDAQSDTENWDIAFKGTSVTVNSGTSGPGEAEALMLDLSFDDVEIAPSEGYSVDSDEATAITGSDGWYTYTGQQVNPAHAIIANDDVTIVLKTADGNHYAKLHIMSYYEDSPDYDTEEFANLQTRPESQYYTFRYALQQTEGLRELQ